MAFWRWFFLFPRWDMWILWRVFLMISLLQKIFFWIAKNTSVEAPYPQGRLEITRLEALFQLQNSTFQKRSGYTVFVYGCFRKRRYPQNIHFNRVFHYKSSILEYLYFWKHPHIYIYIFKQVSMFGEVWENVFGIQTLSKKTLKHDLKLTLEYVGSSEVCAKVWSGCNILRKGECIMVVFSKVIINPKKRSFRFSTWSFLIYQNHFFHQAFLGGGFKYFLFSPLPGELIQFD